MFSWPLKIFNNQGHVVGYLRPKSAKTPGKLSIREAVSDFIDDLSSPMNVELVQNSHKIHTFAHTVNDTLYHCTVLTFYTPFKVKQDDDNKHSPEKSVFNLFSSETVVQSQPA